MQKKFVSTLAISAVLLSLVACSTGTNEAQGGSACDTTAAGASSDKVEAVGDFGTAPKVTFDDPLTAKTTERTVLIEGKGDPAAEGSTLTVQYSAYNATSGDEIEVTSYDDEGAVPFTLSKGQLLPGLLKALSCSSVGDRVAAVIPPVDAFKETGNEQLSVGPSDSLVFVIDVTDIAAPVEVLPRADGEDQPLPEGFPAIDVTLDDAGVPTVTLPDTAPPAEFQVAVLKKGDGAVVADDADVTTNYQGIIWSSKTVFNDSWAAGEPVPFNVGQVVPGFSQMLVGQTVGSQVIAILPPASGYGDTPPEGSGIAAGDTLVFIVDILAAQ